MITETQVANMALLHVKGARILDLKAENAEARACRDAWEISLKAALRLHPWNFATLRMNLPVDATGKPDFGFDRRFVLPSDFVRLVDIGNLAGKYRFDARGWWPEKTRDYEVEGQYILANVGAPLQLRYVRTVANPAEWDALFTEVYSYVLASKIAFRLAGMRSLADSLFARAIAMLEPATNVDGQENLPVEIPDGDWINCR